MTEERERLRQLNALRIDVELDGLIDAARRVHGAALDKSSLWKACIEAPRAARPSTWKELQAALGDNAQRPDEPLNSPEDIFADDEIPF